MPLTKKPLVADAEQEAQRVIAATTQPPLTQARRRVLILMYVHDTALSYRWIRCLEQGCNPLVFRTPLVVFAGRVAVYLLAN